MTIADDDVVAQLVGPDAATFAHLFHALADPTRLSIVQHLTLGEHRIRDLVEHLGLAQSTVSVHISRLRDCGLVTSRPQGRATVVALREPAALIGLLARAADFVESTGQTSSCHHVANPSPTVA